MQPLLLAHQVFLLMVLAMAMTTAMMTKVAMTKNGKMTRPMY
jgi:hypothetical protein